MGPAGTIIKGSLETLGAKNKRVMFGVWTVYWRGKILIFEFALIWDFLFLPFVY